MDINLKLKASGVDLMSIPEEVENQLKVAIRGIAMASYDFIMNEAQQKLITARQDYIKSLTFDEFNDGGLFVITIEKPGEHFEEGWGTFDIKPGLLRGPNAKRTKSGILYNTVPFSHHPSAKRVPTRLGPDYMSDLKKAVKEMVPLATPKPIYDRSGKVVMGHLVAKAGPNTIKKDERGYLQGMIKVQKQYKKTTQNTYTTFRRVTENTPPNRWIHPGYDGLHLFDAAEKYIDTQIDQIIKMIF